MVLKVTCAWLQPFLIHVVTDENGYLSSSFYLGHMVNQQRIIISPFPRFLYFYATKNTFPRTSIQTITHWKVIKWYLMPWHIIGYLETACLFSPIFFSFISNHFQFNHVYILILPLYALQIPIIILLEKRYEVHVLYIDKKIETCGFSFFQMIYKWGIRGQNKLIEDQNLTTIFYYRPKIISDSF